MKLNQLLLAGLSGALFTASAWADTTLVVTGGNASITLLYDRTTNAVLANAVIVPSPTNANIRTFIGTIPSQPGLGKVTIHYSHLGAAAGIVALRDQVNVALATNAPAPAQVAVSSTAPETVGIDGSIFGQDYTAVVPFAFIKNPNLPNSLGGLTNLTQRQVTYLEGASGTLPTVVFGGSSTNELLYFVGRDSSAAVRQILDASVYFTGTAANYTTNPVAGQPPILHPAGGAGSGGEVKAIIGVLSNAVGTVAAQDISTYTPLAYEGVSYSITNVANGSYPLWGYERWLHKSSGSGQPSAAQLAVINALVSAIQDPAFQSTNSLFVGKFVSPSSMQVGRTSDGGPITSLVF